MHFEKFENFIFDLDGTIWWWNELVPGAREVVRELGARGKKVWFLTNNCVFTREGFVRRLARFGIKTEPERILNPSLVLPKLFKGKSVYVIGEGIIRELKRAGAKLVQKEPDAVLVSEDRKVNFRKFVRAVDALLSGAKGYKTASGGTWFVSRTRRIPGTGAIAATIEACMRAQLELIGKPSSHMLAVIRSIGLKPKETILFGDELSSDILAGKKLGFKTAFVLSGRDTLKDCRQSNIKPDFVLKSIAEIL